MGTPLSLGKKWLMQLYYTQLLVGFQMFRCEWRLFSAHVKAASTRATSRSERYLLEVEGMGFFDVFIGMIFGAGDTASRTPITKDPPVCPQCQLALSPQPQGTCACERCAGLWLPNESFQDYLASSEPVPETSGSGGGQHTYQRSASIRSCAVCDRSMDNYQFGYQSGIWIDACPERHGIWLDAGELEMVRQYHRQSMTGEMSSADKAKMAMAFLDGATTANQNRLKVHREIEAEKERRRSLQEYSDY
jgi:Zn-finger nucleic acid-binding protein